MQEGKNRKIPSAKKHLSSKTASYIFSFVHLRLLLAGSVLQCLADALAAEWHPLTSINCKRLVSANANDWSVAMQLGGQVRCHNAEPMRVGMRSLPARMDLVKSPQEQGLQWRQSPLLSPCCRPGITQVVAAVAAVAKSTNTPSGESFSVPGGVR